jgi:Tol biopolymer transport system component/DNA-binding winged helix-turn-helix (wHTH) protein
VSKSEQIKRFYDFGPYRVDAGERVLLREGKPVMLTPKLFDTLLALVERSGHIVEKSELMEMVWPGTFVEESNLSSSVSLLRKTLGSAADGSSYIETVPRRGYRFASAVEMTDESMGVLVGRRTRVHVVTREEEETLGEEEISEIKTLPATTELEAVRSSRLPLAANKPDRRLIVFGIFSILAVITSVGVMIRFLGKQSPASKTAAAFAKIKLTRLTTTGLVYDAAISPDAKFLAHVVETSGQQSLWLRNIATGSNQEIVPASPGKLSGLTFSPDGNHIYFIRSPSGEPGPNMLFQVPVLGGQPRKLLTDIDTSITFSPDGKRLAFARGMPSRGQRLLVLAKADGTEELVLATHKLEDRSLVGPAWSPNGETIVFALGGSSNDAQYLNLVEVRLKDRIEKQVTFHQWSSITTLCWMHDGKGLVVSAAEEPGSNSQIWYVSYPAGNVRSITNDLNDYVGLGLAADSASLVAVQTEKVSDIWMVPDGDAVHAQRITSNRADGGGGISWTPDGRIVYTSVVGGNQEIWIMNKNGSGRQQLTFAGSWESRPSVSPDGRYIIFASRQGGSTNIWRMDIDGTNRKQLTRSNTDSNPQVSPDNQWVIYTSAQSGQISIWKVTIEGGAPIQVTNHYSPLLAVSPKDGQIAHAYDDQVALKRRVALMPSDGGASTRVFDFPHPFRQGIRFAPDGRTLTFLGVPSRSTIWSQPLDGTAPKKIADFAPDRIFSFDWSRDGKYLAVAHGTNTSDVVLIKNQP